jgi:S-adenosyl methyltransferase
MTATSRREDYELPKTLDTAAPNSARIWNYWLGGKANFAVDREAGDRFRKDFPGVVDVAREVRAFLVRAVTYLAGEAGIRQFVDIGAGLPTSDNTHEVAQRIAPESRVVYVDNDPIVLMNARALLASGPEGTTEYIYADVRQPEKILEVAAGTLDFTQPIALILLGILGHLTDDDETLSIVQRLMDALPPGSYLALCDGAPMSVETIEAHRRYNETGAVPYILRDPETIARFFEGLDVLEPGIVEITRWRPDPDSPGLPDPVHDFGGIGRKP